MLFGALFSQILEESDGPCKFLQPDCVVVGKKRGKKKPVVAS